MTRQLFLATLAGSASALALLMMTPTPAKAVAAENVTASQPATRTRPVRRMTIQEARQERYRAFGTTRLQEDIRNQRLQPNDRKLAWQARAKARQAAYRAAKKAERARKKAEQAAAANDSGSR